MIEDEKSWLKMDEDGWNSKTAEYVVFAISILAIVSVLVAAIAYQGNFIISVAFMIIAVACVTKASVFIYFYSKKKHA
jgi:hypothetical protein